MRDIRLIDKEGRVGRQDKLGSDIVTDLLHHLRETSLHLRMEMDLWFIDDQHATSEIISINGENHY